MYIACEFTEALEVRSFIGNRLKSKLHAIKVCQKFINNLLRKKNILVDSVVSGLKDSFDLEADLHYRRYGSGVKGYRGTITKYE